MTWTDKNGVGQNTEIVMTISNWHFNRSTLKDPIGPTCKVENVMVTLKLSSSVFESPTAATAYAPAYEESEAADKDDGSSSSGGRAVVSRNGEIYHFDKSGCIIPFAAFIHLIDSKEFEEYLLAVKSKYNQKDSENKTAPSTSSLSSAAFKELNDDELLSLKKKLSRKRKTNLLYAQSRKNPIIFEDEQMATLETMSSQPVNGSDTAECGDDDDDPPEANAHGDNDEDEDRIQIGKGGKKKNFKK